MPSFEHVVASEQELRDLIGVPGARAVQKEQSALDGHARAFIACSPFLLMATAGADGRCDVAPKGDAPGFVLVLDEHRLVVPDRPGNKRLDGMTNLLANPHIGLVFLVPGRDETLRVNGRATITRDPALLARCAARGRTPPVAIGVQVEQCFFHCTKAFRRAKLWAADTWSARDALPSLASVLFEQIQPAGLTVKDYEAELERDATERLY